MYYDYLNEGATGNVRGSFTRDKNREFQDTLVSVYENFSNVYQLDLWEDVSKILKNEILKESYKEQLMGDVLESNFNDPWYDTHKTKVEQLFENSALEVVAENVGMMNPIVGFTLPILKKNYYENVLKDIIMTEVPDKPFIKMAFERSFLKDQEGKKHYIPDVFYNNDYKKVYDQTVGESFEGKFIEGSELPLFGVEIIPKFWPTKGIAKRDTLSYDFGVKSVEVKTVWPEGTTSIDPLNPSATPVSIAGQDVIITSHVDVMPDYAANGVLSADLIFRYPNTLANGHVVNLSGVNEIYATALLFGRVDAYNSKTDLSVSSTTSLAIEKVNFMGHISNENNNRTVELDYERKSVEYKIEDGPKLNTGLTLEKIKDSKALLNIELTSKLVSDMTTVLTNMEDNGGLDFLDNSFHVWKDKTDLPFGFGSHVSKGKFVERARFSAIPPASVMVTQSNWIGTELKFNLDRLIDQLKKKLYEKDIMFVVYGNPALITLLQDQVQWVVDEDSKVGGVQLEYRFGVLTGSKTRIHVVSTQKVPESAGIRIVAHPLTTEVVTFKHYKYSLNIENTYRNPITTNVPNIMATQRVKTIELLPVQGEFAITNTGFGNLDTRDVITDQPGYKMR